MSTPSPRRFTPHLLLLLPTLLSVGGVFWIQSEDPFGDQGIANAFSAIAGLVGLFFLYVWFVTSSWFPPVLRRGVGFGVVLGLGILLALFRFEGVSGNMRPEMVWRFAPPPEREAEARAPESGVDLVTEAPTDFPGFFGPRRDGVVTGVSLRRDWEAAPPEELWRGEVGEAWSAFAIRNGVAVTQEQWGAEEAVTAYDLRTGSLLWEHRTPGDFEHFLGGNGPRGTPTIDGGRVYALSATGRFVCLDGRDGKALWSKDLLAEYELTPEREAELVGYGRSNSALIVDDLVVLPAGGDPAGRQAGLAAWDKVTGELRWESPPRQISFASPSLVTLLGRRMILIVNESSVTGHDPGDGAILFEFSWPGLTPANASSSQAHAVGEDGVFVSKGYGIGGALHRLVEREGGRISTEAVWENSRAPRTKYTNAVIHAGHVYGLSDGILACVSLADGERVWRSGRYGHGQVLLVGELLLVLSEEGELLLVEATPERPNEVLGRFQALEGKTWNHVAFSGDLLAVRNASEAAVYRLPTH